jgi:hypothetical protein
VELNRGAEDRGPKNKEVMVNYFDNPDYSVIVVGAGRGIGRAAADLLASQGVAVGCLDSVGETAEAAADAIKKRGGRAFSAQLDITDDAAIAPRWPPPPNRSAASTGWSIAPASPATPTSRRTTSTRSISTACSASICAAPSC